MMDLTTDSLRPQTMDLRDMDTGVHCHWGRMALGEELTCLTPAQQVLPAHMVWMPGGNVTVISCPL